MDKLKGMKPQSVVSLILGDRDNIRVKRMLTPAREKGTRRVRLQTMDGRWFIIMVREIEHEESYG